MLNVTGHRTLTTVAVVYSPAVGEDQRTRDYRASKRKGERRRAGRGSRQTAEGKRSDVPRLDMEFRHADRSGACLPCRCPARCLF